MSKSYWKLTDVEYEFIKGEVIHIFEKYNIKCIPVSGFEIASKMKITLIAYSSLSRKKLKTAMEVSEDGFFIEKDGREYIFYNDIDRCYERQNWTILHEIGHIVLDHSEDSELAEKEVKFFAKYALVPPVLVHKLKLDNPMDIADIFEVSFEAACYAYSYYQKWLQYGSSEYTKYELTLLNLFQSVS